MATQFHPEKSGEIGLSILAGFLGESADPLKLQVAESAGIAAALSKRIIACLDVRRDEDENLVVTKGLSYDVMEEEKVDSGGNENENENGSDPLKKKLRVRNLGDPVEMSEDYSTQGVDELTFLSIKSYANSTLGDTPLHRLLERTSEKVFVPLTIGGGIRDYKEKDGTEVKALDVASQFFRSGADKVSIGSDAVRAVQKLQANNNKCDDSTSIEAISHAYGKQAVVVSVDPKRVYLDTPKQIAKAESEGHTLIEVEDLREESETFGKTVKCWYSATTSGGKTLSDLDAVDLVKGVETLGAGEILLNCIDFDGQGKGFDIQLINTVCNATTLPVIASSGAGKAEHFSELFKQTRAEAGLAAGIFHRKETTVAEVKNHIMKKGVSTRL
eukprot:CAMPEP_0204832684 /NCGR_PEP_ID=MMETSP1346-20131115/14415_1 /ASSEMBLY_ACC=CAM_ASM_000771 /TAXON_ID=215587 /ORGANISM="Aplanochytrium stocchinoi, Strain GSBS06" /LENGTH=386 /DNA_ID=CAMNT_0051964661 /DNA_START=235 /DNA_END=1395 /DNA_ORIENTATION=+